MRLDERIFNPREDVHIILDESQYFRYILNEMKQYLDN
jgi:hypothetical protein